VFAKLRSDVLYMLSDNKQHCVPVELYFDADCKDDIRNHLISNGHFIVLTDIDTCDSQNGLEDDFSSNSAVRTATPTQEGMGKMWNPSLRKANTDPLPQPRTLIQSHNQFIPVTSPSSTSMWKPNKMAPTNLSFSEH